MKLNLLDDKIEVEREISQMLQTVAITTEVSIYLVTDWKHNLKRNPISGDFQYCSKSPLILLTSMPRKISLRIHSQASIGAHLL